MSIGVLKLERKPLNVRERAYIPAVIAGMFITLRHLLKNMFNIKGLPTINYPEVKRVYSERFRGRHILTTRQDGTTRCVACFMCSTACPAECITIEAPGGFFCGFCVDACPEDAIYMTRDYEMAIDPRARATVGLRDLVVPPNFPVSPMGWRPYYGAITKRGTAGGTGIGQPLREAPFEDNERSEE